jgi:diguanylate cyclase (GGDEF)-like protein
LSDRGDTASERPGAHPSALEEPPSGGESGASGGDGTGEAGFRWFSWLILAFAAAGAVAMALVEPFTFTAATLPTAALFLVAFVAAETLAINIDVRSGISWTVSFTEIPLVVGLMVAEYELILVTHVIAGVGTLVARGVNRRKLYNSGVLVIEITTAYAVATTVAAAMGAQSITWPAAFAGAVAAPAASTVLAMVSVWVLRNRMKLSTGLRFMTRVLVVGMINASAGLVGYLVATEVPAGWLLVAAMGIGLAGLYWAYGDLLREQRDIDALADVSLMVARSGQLTDTGLPGEFGPADWEALAARIKDQLAARRVVLRLRLDGANTLTTVVAGDPLDGEDVSADDPLIRLPHSRPRHVRLVDSRPDVRRALAARGAEEVLICPLRSATQLLGVVEAHDRRSRWRGFAAADLQLLGAMSAHLATALDNRRLTATIKHDAYHDPLTGLLNRPGISHAARGPLASGRNVVLLRVDLDNFSTVCDALGYAWADRMVSIAGRRLVDVLGPEVPVARLEGASFAALLTCPESTAREIAEQVRSELSMPYPIDRLTVEAHAIVGYASSDVDDAVGRMDVDGLLQRADVALRAITTSGNTDEVRGYVPSMGQIFMRRFQLVSQFRQALESNQVTVHYQPKISLPKRTVLGVEALVRWKHPEFGDLHPDEFIPPIEAAGLIGALTSFVLDEALARARKWLDAGLRISVAVNMSVRSLSDEEFPGLVAAALQRFQVPPELLTLELTESGVMADRQRALPILRELHALGVVLAVDDFGTGYSSLAYLRQLPVDEVKIDKSFVLGMGTDLNDLAVVRSIVELGHSLGLTVVAEGVEEDVARDQLEAMGCDVAQGYLISRPLCEERLEAWLHARTARHLDVQSETVLKLLN